ncbi:thymidine phosphorylase [Phaeobacter inhibens]|uniref:thymidine phosphorylase n=1 Tax=Phaeobacter inhibens TaxID=221822 RepID=UPI0001632F07|nr:thymidine phosphorylase [Phaeobacter inhibens]AFO90912.1 thymidine phosphorylase DeoA [Phaeobacter inhibens DSM 17395]AUQ45570.1 thymidine phosphorylase DeoA [Phaeobacter inhibens]AXT22401.1 thymidine phosphorylase [Phaeobacter inhibens]
MDARAIIASLRRGDTPSDADLRWFAEGLANGTVSDAQAGAFAMAVCLQGLGVEARGALTLAMRDSGDVLRWDLDGPVLDKHSTGGVGDCVSLLLAPALAECGAYVPMISGRGLGHTGGTLDKMEAIPGVSIQVSEQDLVAMMQGVGCAIVGATAQIAPADKRLYAIRDVTATVDSLDLITASILSKKLAASTDALVLDVKIGSGAFMKTLEEAEALALSLTETANAAGCRTSALITDMNQPLAPALGNALEVAEVMRVLTGVSGQGGALTELTAEQGGVLLAHGGLAADAEAGAEMIRKAIASGAVAERFARMVAAMGGSSDFAETWQTILPTAPVQRRIKVEQTGYVSAIDGEALGLAVVQLGGGRMIESDVVDPAVGLSELTPLGQKLSVGDQLGIVHAADEAAADVAETRLRAAYQLSDAAPDLPPLIYKRIS